MRLFIVFLLILTSFQLYSKVESVSEFKISEVISIKKSSKSKFREHYLFVAKLEDGFKFNNLVLNRGDYIEVLAKKSICYDEVKLGFLINRQFKMNVSNIKIEMAKKASAGKIYAAFFKISSLKDNASCDITKVSNNNFQ